MIWLLTVLLGMAPFVVGTQYPVSAGMSIPIVSPYYPYSYYGYADFDRCYTASNSVNFSLECKTVNSHTSDGCSFNYFQVQQPNNEMRTLLGNGAFSYSHISKEFRIVLANYNLFYDGRVFCGFACSLTATALGATSATPSTPTSATPSTPTSTPTLSSLPSSVASTVSPNNSSSVISPTCQCGIKNTVARIVGGHVATMNEYPWQCMLKDKTGFQYCGCSVICQKYILTASHCVVNSTASQIFVSAGDYQKNIKDETNLTQTVGVKQIIMHENYDPKIMNNDIALLELQTPLNFTNGVSPVCLPFGMENKNISSVTMTVTGWGTTSFGGKDSPTLLEVDIPALTTNECKEYYQDYVNDNMFCTYQPGKDSCQGDSGGPLIMQNTTGRYVQMGVVSWGFGCAAEDDPGVYTKLTNYLNWIKSKTSGSSACKLCQP